MCKRVVIDDLKIGMDPPLEYMLIDGVFKNESGRWECSQLRWIEFVDSVDRGYLADRYEGSRVACIAQEKKDLKKLAKIISDSYPATIAAACESAIAAKKVHPGHSP